MATPADILVISPHPDDAEFGAAGTVATWTRTGKQVIYVVCTNGDKGSTNPDLKPEQLVPLRKKSTTVLILRTPLISSLLPCAAMQVSWENLRYPH